MAMNQISRVRMQIFLSGALVIVLGFIAVQALDGGEALGFLHGALTLGGALLICGFFSLKSQWHGIIGAGVLALLGAGRGLGNFPHLLDALSGKLDRPVVPLIELGVTLICLVLLGWVLAALNRERVKRMLEKD